MATSTGPDLSSAVAAVRALMDDEVRIERPGSGEGVMDENTLIVTPPTNSIVHTSLPATISAPSQPSVGEVAAVAVSEGRYLVKVPLEVTNVQRNDIVVVVSARRDPALVNRRLRVEEVIASTFAVARKLACVVDR